MELNTLYVVSMTSDNISYVEGVYDNVYQAVAAAYEEELFTNKKFSSNITTVELNVTHNKLRGKCTIR